MRKLWVKAWITLDGVFDANTMDHWWQNTNSPERMQYITEQYSQGDIYMMGRTTYEMLWPGWSKQSKARRSIPEPWPWSTSRTKHSHLVLPN